MKKSTVFTLFIIILGGIIGGYTYFKSDGAVPYEFVIAERGDIIQEVSVTGRVKPAKSVDLAFEKSGKISRVYADVGDHVDIGQALIVLENAEISAQLAQAEATLEKDEAKLAELKRGTRSEEIQVQKIKVANAKIALEDAEKNLVDTLQDAYTKSDDAIRNKVDQFFNNPKSSNPQLSFLLSDSQLQLNIEEQRFSLEKMLLVWKSSLEKLTVLSDFTFYITEAKTQLDQIKLFLEKTASAVNGLAAHATLSQSTVDAWKADVSTGRTNINTAIADLSAAEEKLRTEESDLALAEQELTLKEAGTIEEKISAQEAQIKEANANIDYYRAQLAKTVIRTPINGIVTKQDAKVGEIVSASTVIVSLISESKFEIEAHMPEADIAKIQKNNKAIATLDAYGRDVTFNTQVVAINPAETIIEGVATYKVTLQFIEEDKRVRSGMTAKIVIFSGRREHVIVVPQRAIMRKNGNKFIRILDDNNVKEVFVETGLRGSDGTIEIISGVNEGDKVITFSTE